MPNQIAGEEWGAMLCKMPDGKLVRGPLGVGTATSVQFPETCPAGAERWGPWHTHPKEGGGSILPSRQDIRETARLNAKGLCITNNDRTQCYLAKGKK